MWPSAPAAPRRWTRTSRCVARPSHWSCGKRHRPLASWTRACRCLVKMLSRRPRRPRTELAVDEVNAALARYTVSIHRGSNHLNTFRVSTRLAASRLFFTILNSSSFLQHACVAFMPDRTSATDRGSAKQHRWLLDSTKPPNFSGTRNSRRRRLNASRTCE